MSLLAEGSTSGGTSVRGVLRFLREHLPDARPLGDDSPALDLTVPSGERPRTISARILEGTTLRAHRIRGAPQAGFAAFLDGVQHSRAIQYVHGIPLVLGTVAAVIRVRRQRRMVTWRQRVERGLYLPLARMPASLRSARPGPVPLVDTLPGADTMPAEHPLELIERAVHRVQADRERLELELAEQWCALEDAPLLIDGGISGSERVAQAACSVGVVKSHRTLYVEGDALRTTLALRVRERSSVLRITSRGATVASWYLRLRDPIGHDPMWGLVRLEVAEDDRMRADPAAVTARADVVSRWVLAEGAPLSLPDPRWDKMVYGVRDCEEFLRSIC